MNRLEIVSHEEPQLDGYQDLAPAKVSFSKWNELFERIPLDAIAGFRYYRDCPADWSTYLFPPCTYSAYGARHLKRLQFDNGLAAWRLWSFLLSESERLFRARQVGKSVVATSGDLGVLPVLVSGFSNAVPFYPDCHWATPFLGESSVLFDAAQRYGLGENACFSRASLGAAFKGAYFPEPALYLCASGATCDDFHAVMDLIQWSGRRVHWFGIPHCRDAGVHAASNGHPAHDAVNRRYLVQQLERAAQVLSQALQQPWSPTQLQDAIARVNRLRATVDRLRHLTFSAPRAPLPAVEAYYAEYALLHYYGDLEECQRVLDHLLATVEQRVRAQQGVLQEDALKVVWVSPTPDPRVLDFWESLGGRVVGTEYLNRQSLLPLRTDLPPLEALAEALLHGSLFGTTRRRTGTVLEQCHRYGAQGVIISSTFGASHCAAETSLLAYLVKRAGLPALHFEVPFTGAQLSGQVRTRLEAFAELLRGRS